MEIIRTKTRASGGITPEEEIKLKAHAELWIERAMRTTPIEKDKIVPAIEGLYNVSGLKKPRIIIVPSPLVMALAGGIASAVWYLRKNTATRNATYDATHNETDAAMRNATKDATNDATIAATYDATDAATENATQVETRAATRNTTRAATDDAWVYEVCKDFVGEKNVAFAFSCIQSVMNIYQGGNMWADYECYLTAPRDVLGLELPIYEKYNFWEQAAVHGGFRIMQDEFCLVSDFPEILLKSQQNQAHCETGPSHRWRDGWELYHLNGVRFEKELWTKIVNKKLSFKEIMQIKDIDKQAIAMKYMPAMDFLKSVKAELVCEKTAKGNELWKVPIEPSKVFDQDEYFLHYFCPSSGREYLQAVEHDKAIESKFNADYLMALRHKFLLSEYLSSDFISV